jgi:hypothetical protein
MSITSAAGDDRAALIFAEWALDKGKPAAKQGRKAVSLRGAFIK